MTTAAATEGDFLDTSRRFLDVLGPDGIGDEYESRDYAVDGIEPRWLLLPASREECAGALRIASSAGLAVVPAGFGLRLGQGRTPERVDAVVSLRRMDGVVEHAAADLTVTVEAGASLGTLNESLRARGQWLALDPPFAAQTSIGGMIACQASGPTRHAYGTPRESLIGVRAVLANGTEVKSGGRVVKNVAGYDLHRLLCGSFGTLAVIVEASFKLRPMPEEGAAVTFTAPAPEALFRLAQAIACSTVAPLAVELFADHPSGWWLAVCVAGLREEVACGERRLLEIARASGEIQASGRVSFERVIARSEEVARPVERGADAIVLRLGEPPAVLGDDFTAAVELSRNRDGRVLAHAHAAAGVARLRFEGLGEEDAVALVTKLRRAAERVGGYVVVESAPTDWKSRLDPWGTPRTDLEIMKRVKAAFDPGRVLSPGRFIGGI